MQWHGVKLYDVARPGCWSSVPPSLRSSPGCGPRGICRGRFGVPRRRGTRWRPKRSIWSSSTATRPGWTRPRCAGSCATTSGWGTRGCWRSRSRPRAGWPTAVLNAGADDYLHRPFTRAELIARTRAGLRAAQERSNDRLLRTLMENVPGAIYRSAWHADYQLEMITDEIERISGLPAGELPASSTGGRSSVADPPRRRGHGARDRRDGERGLRGAVRDAVPDRPRRRRRALGARPRPARPRPRRAPVGRRRDVRHHRAPPGRGGAAAPRGRGGPHGRAASVAGPHHRGRRQGAAQDRARPARRRAAAARQPRARRPGGQAPDGQGPVGRRGRSSTGSATSSRTRPRSCASSPAASTRRC